MLPIARQARGQRGKRRQKSPSQRTPADAQHGKASSSDARGQQDCRHRVPAASARLALREPMVSRGLVVGWCARMGVDEIEWPGVAVGVSCKQTERVKRSVCKYGCSARQQAAEKRCPSLKCAYDSVKASNSPWLTERMVPGSSAIQTREREESTCLGLLVGLFGEEIRLRLFGSCGSQIGTE